MAPRNASLLALFTEGRTRFTKVLDTLTEADLQRKLAPAPNSVGFIVRHIGDVELLFAKNVFKLEGVQVHASTVAKGYDTGEWTNLAARPEHAKTKARLARALPTVNAAPVPAARGAGVE